MDGARYIESKFAYYVLQDDLPPMSFDETFELLKKLLSIFGYSEHSGSWTDGSRKVKIYKEETSVGTCIGWNCDESRSRNYGPMTPHMVLGSFLYVIGQLLSIQYKDSMGLRHAIDQFVRKDCCNVLIVAGVKERFGRVIRIRRVLRDTHSDIFVNGLVIEQRQPAMKRDASPKRKKSRRKIDPSTAIQAFNLVKQHCDFKTLVTLYETAKSLWPIFAGFKAEISCNLTIDRSLHTVFISSLEFWQHLLQCYRNRSHVMIDDYRGCYALAIASAALCGCPVTALTKELGISLTNETTIVAAIANGNLEFYQKYLSHCDLEGIAEHYVDLVPPLFSGTLNASFRRKRRMPKVELQAFFCYVENVAHARSVNGLVHANAMLRRKWNGATARWWFMKQRDFWNRRDATTIAKICYEWGHPKALRFIETFLKPFAQEK